MLKWFTPLAFLHPWLVSSTLSGREGNPFVVQLGKVVFDAGGSARSARSKGKAQAQLGWAKAKKGKVGTLSTFFTCWRKTPENHLKDINGSHRTSESRLSLLNTMSSKQVRLAFFGMTMKSPMRPLWYVSEVGSHWTSKEGVRLRPPLADPQMTLTDGSDQKDNELSKR